MMTRRARDGTIQQPPVTRVHVREAFGHGLTVYRVRPALANNGHPSHPSHEPFCPAPPMPLDRWEHTIELLEAGWTRHVWRWTPPVEEVVA